MTTLAKGDTLTITNPNPVAATYCVQFGAAGAVRLTVAPGGEFQIIGGELSVDVHLEEISPPGLRPA